MFTLQPTKGIVNTVKKVYKRYSEAFRIQVVREYEQNGYSLNTQHQRYGVSHITLKKRIKKYSTQGLIYNFMTIRTLEERDRMKELEAENARLKAMVADLMLEFMLDQRFPDDATAYRAVSNAIRLYNTRRPHLSLDYATPAEVYARGLQQTAAQPAIAEPDQKEPSQSRGEGGVCLRLAKPLTGSSFLIQSAQAGCATVPQFFLL